ncbi:uncharacterized protein LOC129004157 [Macrosteles quadrilineatus]|uniref:uncharacterized protein LOC129004157 n=1 Tax=Macrosteles quadrilineatus TaxID=74068 RepID=UPI0023E0E2D9|nr:uncharacterized protein LOC129004157 [Macrosteles quadrilineatus]
MFSEKLLSKCADVYCGSFSVCFLIYYFLVTPTYQNFTDSIYDDIIFYTNQSTWKKTPKPTPYMYHNFKIISDKKINPHNAELFRIYWTLNETLDVLFDPKYEKEEGAIALKRIWHDAITPKKTYYRSTRKPKTTTEPFWYWEQPTKKQPGRQNPFILVEGTDRRLKRYLMKRIMKNTGCTRIRTIPKTTYKLRKKFEGAALLPLKRAFVTLQLYLAALDVNRVIETEPVIMSGFWLNHAAEYMARKYDNETLPPLGSECYNWPQDLVKPDLTFYLNTPREVKKGGKEEAHRYMRVVEVVKRMQPPVIMLNETYSNATLGNVIHLRYMMKDMIGSQYPHIRFIKPEWTPPPK